MAELGESDRCSSGEDSDQHIYDSPLIEPSVDREKRTGAVRRRVYFLASVRAIFCGMCERKIYATNHRCPVARPCWLDKKSKASYERRLFELFLQHDAGLYRLCSRKEYACSSKKCLKHLPWGKDFRVVDNTLYQQIPIPGGFSYDHFVQQQNIVPVVLNKTYCSHKNKNKDKNKV